MRGERLKRRREEQGWTAAELARRAGVSKAYLSRLEAGKTVRPSAAILERLAAALGTTVADLREHDLPPAERSVPEALRDFAAEAGLSAEDVAMLAGIRLRGRQPATAEDWRFVFEAIRRSLPRD
jgi:transcriptional regulator with XRE-family HTH domain